MKSEIENTGNAVFEQIKEIDENGNEFWGARKLSNVLEYSEFRHFIPVIERAKEATVNSGQAVLDHFEDVLDMVSIGSGAEDSIKKLEEPIKPKEIKKPK